MSADDAGIPGVDWNNHDDDASWYDYQRQLQADISLV